MFLACVLVLRDDGADLAIDTHGATWRDSVSKQHVRHHCWILAPALLGCDSGVYAVPPDLVLASQ